MMKKEFEILLGQTVSDEDYKQIEFVYTFYDEKLNKQDIVQIYKIGGMQLINDMNARSEINREMENIKARLAGIESKKEDIHIRMEKLEQEMDRLFKKCADLKEEENKLHLQEQTLKNLQNTKAIR